MTVIAHKDRSARWRAKVRAARSTRGARGDLHRNSSNPAQFRAASAILITLGAQPTAGAVEESCGRSRAAASSQAMRPIWFVLFCAMAYGCDSARDEHAPASASAGALVARSDGGNEPGDAGAGDAASAWTQFSRRDDVPLCLFARYADWGNAQLLADAKHKISLKAGRPLYFGTYVPGCADPECVRRVTLQCWADVEGKSITVHTRFSGEQQVDHPCANNCKPSTAACETPALQAGVYTLTHGAQQRTIRVPGVVQPACLQGDAGPEALER